MSKYVEYLRRRRKDLENNLDGYLRMLKELATDYNGKLYVFGSYIRGEAIALSDIDVLLEIPDNIDRLEVLHKARKLVPNSKIEIHVLNKKDAEEFKKIIKKYVEI